jgi:hypothetical protein
MAKKITEKQDARMDKRAGIKENSPADARMDRMHGVMDQAGRKQARVKRKGGY